MLCDDPGAGKTITVLSLILQTFGQSTERSTVDERGSCESSFLDYGNDGAVFKAYWKEGITSEMRVPSILRLLNSLCRADSESTYFEVPVGPIADGCADYFDVVKHPISMSDILQKINMDAYGDDLERLCADVSLCFRNAMLYNPPDHPVHRAAERLFNRFKAIVEHFKSSQLESAKRAVRKNPDGSLAALLAEKAKEELIDSLLPSLSTLLVVPNTLLHHWEEQIKMHVDFSYCTGNVPYFFDIWGTMMGVLIEGAHLFRRLMKSRVFVWWRRCTVPLSSLMRVQQSLSRHQSFL